MSRRRRAGMHFEVAGRLFQCFAGWLAWSGGRHVCIALFHTRCHKTMREDDGIAAASWGRREWEDAHGMCASCMHVCICTLATLKNEPSCGSERDLIDCRELETHTDGRMGNKSACSRSTAVGSGGTVDAAKHWRGLISSSLLNLSIFSYGWREIRSTLNTRSYGSRTDRITMRLGKPVQQPFQIGFLRFGLDRSFERG